MRKIFILYITFFQYVSFAQSVTIDPKSTGSSLFDVKSNNKGILISRMTTSERTSLASPAQGLTIFDTDVNAFYFYNGSVWERLISTSTQPNLGYGNWGDCATNSNISEYFPVANNTESGSFGFSTGISGDYALIGSPYDGNTPQGGFGILEQGSASIFKRNTATGQWEFLQKLTNSNAGSFDHFGSCVAIDGDYAIVGAPDDDDAAGANQGSACIFKRNASTGIWQFQQKLFNNSPSAGDSFGSKVAISGDYVAIGAPIDNIVGLPGISVSDEGTVSIYKRNTSTGVWQLLQEFTKPSGGIFNGGFGANLSIASDYLAVCSKSPGNPPVLQTEVSIYKRNVSTGLFDYLQDLPTIPNIFGIAYPKAVAISNDYCAVGIDNEYFTLGIGYGGTSRVAFYKRNLATGNWEFLNYLTQENPPKNTVNDYRPDAFGNTVSISNDYCIVAGDTYAILYRNIGSIFYKLQKIIDPAAEPNLNYPYISVAVDGTNKRFIIGKGQVITLFGKIN